MKFIITLVLAGSIFLGMKSCLSESDEKIAKDHEEYVASQTPRELMKSHLHYLQNMGCDELKGKAIGQMSPDDLRDIEFCKQLEKW